MEIINLIANLLICISVTLFIIAIFGSKNKMVESMNIFEKYLIKIGLTTTSCGSLFNVLTLSTPNKTEILLNVGLSLVFTWAAYFHFKYFINKKG
jgi:hypothetical protein